PPESLVTLSIQALCMFRYTCDCGAMKVWNLSVTLCWAKPTRAGLPTAMAAPVFKRVRRWIMNVFSSGRRAPCGAQGEGGGCVPGVTVSGPGPHGHEVKPCFFARITGFARTGAAGP